MRSVEIPERCLGCPYLLFKEQERQSYDGNRIAHRTTIEDLAVAIEIASKLEADAGEGVMEAFDKQRSMEQAGLAHDDVDVTIAALSSTYFSMVRNIDELVGAYQAQIAQNERAVRTMTSRMRVAGQQARLAFRHCEGTNPHNPICQTEVPITPEARVGLAAA